MSAALAFTDVACLRGGRLLFEGVSFSLAAGAAAVVTGPNGVGKSSMIRIAAGLLPPAAGHIDGEGARALLTEATALDPELELASALRFWARMDGQPDAVGPALDALGLVDLAQVPVRLLSTGQRRRAALARVVASRAPVWLLDEPANGLDVASVAVLERLIDSHRASGGVVLVATHLPLSLPNAREIAL
jgi:heme exporter protein A